MPWPAEQTARRDRRRKRGSRRVSHRTRGGGPLKGATATPRRTACTFLARWSIRLRITSRSSSSSSCPPLRLANVIPNFWSVGANVLAPLFTAGALQAEVTIATAEQQAAVALYGQTALRAFTEVESTLANEELMSEQQQFLESVLTQDVEALRLGRLRYDAGATDLLHVLQMQARQLNTQFDLIAIRNDRLANRVALHLALGGGFPPAP